MDLFKDCYCNEKRRRPTRKDPYGSCIELYIYIASSAGFKPAVIEGFEHVPKIKFEMDQSIVDFCVSKLSQPKKKVASGNQSDKK